MIRARGENSDSIPIDLVTAILSRLPARSIARCRCVSKLWNDSMLSRPYFTELFLTRSSARPRLLFACKRLDDWCFLTSPQPQNPYKKSSSIVVTADFQMKFPGDDTLEFCGHASAGFICFRRRMRISEEDDECTVHVICNPSTGQYASLPLLAGRSESTHSRSFLGFDPIDKQYKVLSISDRMISQILTIGTGNDSWRKIHCPLKHFPRDEGICINGVLYYFPGGEHFQFDRQKIVCFDVRSEKFKFIDIDFITYQYDTKLINYKGRLGLVTLDYSESRYCVGVPSIEVCLWVIKDVEKPESEWSEIFSFRLDPQVVGNYSPSIVGVTATGEIVLSTWEWVASKPFNVFYLSTERNTLQSVEIKGFGANQIDSRRSRRKSSRVRIFVDHVEDLKFIMKDAATSSISPPEQERSSPTSTSTTSAKAHLRQDGRTFESINKFDSPRLLDDDKFS